MTVFVLVIVFLFFVGAEIAKPDRIFPEYCSKSTSNAVKGIFVMCVFTSHFFSYIPDAQVGADVRTIMGLLGQLMVAPFLFYSGYGVAESIKKQGLRYVKRIGIHRAVRTLVHFDVAVCFFAVLQLMLGNPFTLKKLILALVCWDDFGNSTWYIFAIVTLYILTALVYRVLYRKPMCALFAVTGITIAYIVLLSRVRPVHWYDTMLCYVFGMWYSHLREHVEKLVMRNDFVYLVTTFAAFAAFYWLRQFIYNHYLIHNLYAVVFLVLLLLISMKLRLDNGLLQFLGENTFGIYILQRIPMILLTHYGIMKYSAVNMYIACFLITCILSLIFTGCLKMIDARLFRGSRK